MKKFLTALASLTLIATTVPSVVACGKTEALPGQYVQLTGANYDEHRNLMLDDNQMMNLLFLQAADYLKNHPDFRNADDGNETHNKITQKLSWAKGLNFNDNYSSSIRFENIKPYQVKIKLKARSWETFPTVIGEIATDGNYTSVNIYQLDMEPFMLDQKKFNQISEPVNEENIRTMMHQALKS